MRLALLSDLHGNPIALEAVLADVEECGGADTYLVLGDIVAIGHDPIAILDRLGALPGVRFVQGNTDRYVVTGQRPYPAFADVAADPGLIPRLVEVAHSFAWTQGVVTAAGWFDWLLANACADLVGVGHTHWPIDRTVAGVRVVNVGSVSNPLAFDLRASYALIDATETGYHLEHGRVAYDVEAVIKAIERSHDPSGDFIISHFRGERRPWWAAGRHGQ